MNLRALKYAMTSLVACTGLGAAASTAHAATENISGGIQVDSAGTLYLLGSVNPSPTPTTTYLRTLNTQGAVLSNFTMPQDHLEIPGVLRLDSAGNRYVVGYADGNSGGAYYGWRDGFIRKYDPNNTLLWQKQIGTSSYDTLLNAYVDSSDNLYVAGETYGSMAGSSNGWANSIVLKFDSSGNQQWVRQYSFSSYHDQLGSTFVDASGNIYVAGGGTWDGSHFQGFLTRLNPDGTAVWSQIMGSTNVNSGSLQILGADANGNILLVGGTTGSLVGTNHGGWDIVFGRCTPAGQLEWLGQYGTAQDDMPTTSLLEASGLVTLAGETYGSWFTPVQGSFDGIILQLDSSGQVLSGQQSGLAGNDYYNGVVKYDGAYYAGRYLEGSAAGMEVLSVPEPAALALLGCGTLAFIRRRRGSR